jgi:VWFA-related protein
MKWMCGAALAAAAVVCAAQNKPVLERPAQPPATTLTVTAKLVVVPVVVRDKKGALVNNLTKDSFALTVGEKPQVIKYFDHDTDVPLTLGLLVDTSGSQRDQIDSERSASDAFLRSMLMPASGTRPADKAFVIQFAKQVELLSDTTSSTPMLAAALKELGTENPRAHNTDDTGGVDGEGRRIRTGGTALYDAVFLSGDEITSKQTGRKALILLTDGVDNGSKEALADAIEAAQRADTIVYAIYFKGQEHQDFRRDDNGGGRHGGYGGGYPGGGNGGGKGGGQRPNGGGGSHTPHVDGRKVLERICGETGGTVFEVSKKETIDDIYAKIVEELRAQYRLGFTPDKTAADEGYHHIAVTLTGDEAKKKDWVQTREGYYTGADK